MQLNITKKQKTKKGLSRTPKSFKNLYQSLKLNQIKSTITEKEIRKSANQTSKDLKVNKDIPIYEIVLHDITHDISNSVKYIMEKFTRLNGFENEALIYKIENGFKTVFFTH